MILYVGYGFNVEDLTEQQLIDFIRCSPYAKDFEEYLKDADAEEDDVVTEFMEERSGYVSYFVSCAINAAERKRAKDRGCDLGSEDVVVAYDTFVFFDSLRFAEEDKRSQIIRTEEDFLRMLKRYFHELPTIGNILAGTEFMDVAFWME